MWIRKLIVTCRTKFQWCSFSDKIDLRSIYSPNCFQFKQSFPVYLKLKIYWAFKLSKFINFVYPTIDFEFHLITRFTSSLIFLYKLDWALKLAILIFVYHPIYSKRKFNLRIYNHLSWSSKASTRKLLWSKFLLNL